jgi:hypothetical protein
MPSVALREGGQLASNGNKTLKGYNNNILPSVDFFCDSKNKERSDVRRMPSVALCEGGSSWRRRADGRELEKKASLAAVKRWYNYENEQ